MAWTTRLGLATSSRQEVRAAGVRGGRGQAPVGSGLPGMTAAKSPKGPPGAG